MSSMMVECRFASGSLCLWDGPPGCEIIVPHSRDLIL